MTLLPVRYGLTPERMRSRVRLMCAELAKQEITPTIHVTSTNIKRHPEIIADLKTADVGLHGHLHIRYSELTPLEQAADLDASLLTFANHGLEPHGFRAPYLQTNRDTIDLLEERGLSYDSSIPMMTPFPLDAMAQQISLVTAKRYSNLEQFHGYLLPGARIAELPIALPDDEILIDAMNLRNPAVLRRIFLSMTNVAAKTGMLLVLQVHPERFPLCSEGLGAALEAATDLGGWKTSLSEAAAYLLGNNGHNAGWPMGSSFAVAVSGDLDALTLSDFSTRLLGGARWRS